MSSTVNVAHIAKLTNVPVSPTEADKFAAQFESTLNTIAVLNELDTATVEATPQVTNLQNVYREDVIDTSRMFTPNEAVANAPHTANGYFVVEAVLHEA